MRQNNFHFYGRTWITKGQISYLKYHCCYRPPKDRLMVRRNKNTTDDSSSQENEKVDDKWPNDY